MKYFIDDPFSKEMPEFQDWPLMKEAYKMKFDYVFKKSYNILQPKRVSFEEVDNDYYVSPRKLIRYMECEGFGFIFCDYFTM